MDDKKLSINGLISIIIPAYNASDTLSRCVLSVLNQSYKSIEVILVDDGSDDETGSICDSLARTHSRVRVVHKENGGLSSARNAGLDICRGEFVFFLDSDDYIDSKELEILHKGLIDSGSDMAVGGCEYVEEDGSSLDLVCDQARRLDERAYWEQAYFSSYSFHIEYIVSWGKLYRSFLFQETRFDEGKIHEDEFIIHHIVALCTQIDVIPFAGYYYVQRGRSIMHNKSAQTYLDGAESILLRAEYFEGRGWGDLAFEAACLSRLCLCGAEELKPKDVQLNRFKNLCRRYVAISWRQAGKLSFSFSGFAHLVAFSLSPSLDAVTSHIINQIRVLCRKLK